MDKHGYPIKCYSPTLKFEFYDFRVTQNIILLIFYSTIGKCKKQLLACGSHKDRQLARIGLWAVVADPCLDHLDFLM